MPSESDLRDLLKGPDPEGRDAIDLDAVLNRARRRRRPKVVAAQALGSVALVGVLGTAIVVSVPRPAGDSSMLTTQEAAGSSDADAAPFVDDSVASKIIESCGEELMLAPSTDWTLNTASAVYADPGTLELDLTLTPTEPKSGSVVMRSVVVARDGVVVAYGLSLDPVPTPEDLAGGAPIERAAAFAMTSCESEGERLPAGDYDVRPAAEFIRAEDGLGEPIVGSPVALTIG